MVARLPILLLLLLPSIFLLETEARRSNPSPQKQQKQQQQQRHYTNSGEHSGRWRASNRREELAMKTVMNNPYQGEHISTVYMKDPRWPEEKGWLKYRQNVDSKEIHYVLNRYTGQTDDFKFKDDNKKSKK